VATALFDWTTDKINPDLKHSNNLSDEGRAFAEAEDRRPLAEERYEAWRNGQPMPKRFAMAWDHWAPQIKGGCDNGCDHDRMMMGEYSIDHPNGSGPQPGDLMPGIKGRSLLQFAHDIGASGKPELYVSGVHVDENHRRDGVAEALMRRLHQDHPTTPINPGFTTDDGQGLLDGLKKRVPGAGEALVPRFAAVTQNLVDRLGGEFWDWAESNNATNPYLKDDTEQERGPIGYWPHVESFLKEKYPAAHRDLEMGSEEARPILDNPEHNGRLWGIDPYETGPEAIAKHGYDPKEIAAAMLLLHNGSHPGRGDVSQEDQDRLNDIFDKRVKMQRTYEQRQPPPVTASIVRRDGEDDVVGCPSCLTESLADDYGHGGHCPVCGQFNFEYDDHRHGSLRTAMPTYYHHTENPNFQPDSDHEPNSIRNLNHPGGPGIFLTPEERPDMWRRGPNPYRAEFHSDEDVTQKPGVFSENYGLEGAPLEIFVPGDQMHHLDFRGLHPAPRTAMPTYYHLTDNPDFRPDPTVRPENNGTMGGNFDPGLFVSQRPNHWAQGYGYYRPYVSEIDVPDGVGSDFHNSPERFIRPEDYDKIQVKRTLPLDAYSREQWGQSGPVESDLGEDFETGEKFTDKDFGSLDLHKKTPGYKYPGTAMDQTPEWRSQYEQRVRDYQQRTPGIIARRTDT
jgi:hypothetical protein